jgi:hypothetical protein
MKIILTLWVLGLVGVWACMAPDTKILMSDGSYRAIHIVYSRDIVKALDATPGKQLSMTTDVVRVQVYNGLGELYKVKLRIVGEEADSDTLYLTGQHYFCPTKKGERWKRVSTCKVGDRIHALSGKEAEITSVEVVDFSRKDSDVPWTEDYGIQKRSTYNIALTDEVAWYVRREGKTPIAISNEGDLFNYYQKKADQVGTGQPATSPQSKSEGGDKPQPEAEGRSR